MIFKSRIPVSPININALVLFNGKLLPTFVNHTIPLTAVIHLPLFKNAPVSMKNSKILLLCIFETSEQLNIGVKEIKQLNSGWPD